MTTAVGWTGHGIFTIYSCVACAHILLLLTTAFSTSVCILAYLKHHMSKLDKIFCSYLWPWLGPPLMTLCTSGFVEEIMFSHNGHGYTQSDSQGGSNGVKFDICDCLVQVRPSLQREHLSEITTEAFITG